MTQKLSSTGGPATGWKNKLPKGSVLIFTLIILFIILSAAIGISSVSVMERKGAGSTDVSVQSFQIANSGSERILKLISNNKSGILSDVGCASGKVTGSIATGKDYEISFYDKDGAPIANCATPVSQVDKIKAVGSYANTSRAVEVAVAATGPPIGTCLNPADMLFIQFAPSCPSGFSQCNVSQLAIAAKKGCLPILSQSGLVQANTSLDNLPPNFGTVSDLSGGKAVSLSSLHSYWLLNYLYLTTGYTGTADKACCKLGL